MVKMTTPKKRGTNFEYRVAYLFESFGYEWDRSGSSLGIDLKISKDGRLRYLISCKKTSAKEMIYVPKSEAEFLSACAKKCGAEPLICFSFYRAPILALPLSLLKKLPKTRLFFKINRSAGVPLKDFLKRHQKQAEK
ncbi:MAG: restriction endonuclease [Candidatus Hadarchaeales archaeon]